MQGMLMHTCRREDYSEEDQYIGKTRLILEFSINTRRYKTNGAISHSALYYSDTVVRTQVLSPAVHHSTLTLGRLK